MDGEKIQVAVGEPEGQQGELVALALAEVVEIVQAAVQHLRHVAALLLQEE